MLRAIGGTIVGYLVIVVIIMATFTGLYFLMGADRSFREGTYVPSLSWILVTFVLSLLAAMAGGWVSVAVGKSAKAATLLATMVFVLGMALAVLSLNEPPLENPVRSGDVSNFEAMKRAKEPSWVAFTNPILGAIGVVAGARLRKPAAP
ncbi:MAG TPA: hypothetical protein VFW45_06940 [Candidatus Polarisedimenticolia bacterium]|nr:hypothetical protein [Candidatus Polarisedimenticolia bacterium]